MNKTRLCILCGGQSAEHEISLLSACNVAAAVDRTRHELLVVGIDKRGGWWLFESEPFVSHAGDAARIALWLESGTPVTLACIAGRGTLVPLADPARTLPLDVAFPVLHGSHGEDGAVQGLLAMNNLPCVGCDLTSSAVCMDKHLAKIVLAQAGLPVARGCLVETRTRAAVAAAAVVAELGLPLFVKPARLGSSVGVTKVKTPEALGPALDEALRYDTKVLIEECVVGREIECAVLGNHAPEASVPGEVVPQHEFYSYAAKYLDENGAVLKAPADLDEATAARVRELALRSFQALGCRGMARVDMFLTPAGRLVVNELNTIPGFTAISMYPRLWALGGVPYPALVERLIALALEAFAAERALVTDVRPPDAG